MQDKPSRRAFLRGAGQIAIALPIADFASREGCLLAAEGDAADSPRRLITYAIPNGCPTGFWNYGAALQPLAGLRAKIFPVVGLHNAASKNPDHIQGSATLFVGKEPPPAGGGHVAGGPSIERLAAHETGADTKVQVLAVGIWRRGPAFVTEFRRSWDLRGRAVTPLVNPLDAFREVFGDAAGNAEERTLRASLRQSVLDTVVERYRSALSARTGLPAASRERLRAHLDEVREIERKARTTSLELSEICRVPDAPAGFSAAPEQIPYDMWQQIMRQHFRIITMALACDLTRYVSVMVGGTSEEFVAAGVNSTMEHSLAHAVESPQAGALFFGEFLQTRRYQTSLLANLLQQLDGVRMGGATLLDHTVVVAGTEFDIQSSRDPTVHVSQHQPHLVCGGGALGIKSGRELNFGNQRTNNDLYLTCLKAVGVQPKQGPLLDYATGKLITEILPG